MSTNQSCAEPLAKDLALQIDQILANYQHDSNRLVDILLDVQEVVPKHYLPENVVTYISKELNTPLSKIYSVITFYAALSTEPRADYVIQLCDSLVCQVAKNEALKDAISDLLGIKAGQATPDGKYWLEYTSCFGACDVAPAIRINGKVHGNLTSVERVKEVLAQYK